MGKAKHALLWVEEGYLIFASEGIDGIQVERLARSIGFNKSGFYHYFGDLEGYHQELIALHEKKLQHFLLDVKETASLDPDYLELLIRHSLMIMFQVQLLRYKNNRTFYKAGELADEKITLAVRKLWINYMGVTWPCGTIISYATCSIHASAFGTLRTISFIASYGMPGN
jgi:AcrR family transcriptional regulator